MADQHVKIVQRTVDGIHSIHASRKNKAVDIAAHDMEHNYNERSGNHRQPGHIYLTLTSFKDTDARKIVKIWKALDMYVGGCHNLPKGMCHYPVSAAWTEDGETVKVAYYWGSNTDALSAYDQIAVIRKHFNNEGHTVIVEK